MSESKTSVSADTGVGKLSSEGFESLKLSRAHVVQLSLVTVMGDYAIFALRNYKMQAENLYSNFIIVKLLTISVLKH